MSDFPEIKIPFWMNGSHVRTLAGASRVWFGRLGEWAAFPLRQTDPMTCSERMLDLIAWQRGVTRAAGEAERLYRLRVTHAYANARDSGQIAGWKRIFKRLELGDIALEERKAGQDWDVIGIMMDDGSFPNYQNVLELIVADYGRTCRRYHFISRIPQKVAVRFVPFDDHHATLCAKSDEILKTRAGSGIAVFDSTQTTLEAHA